MGQGEIEGEPAEQEGEEKVVKMDEKRTRRRNRVIRWKEISWWKWRNKGESVRMKYT